MESVETTTSIDRKNSLLSQIEETPGIRYRELLRLSGFTNGVLTYHLAVLERSNRIKVDRKSRMTRYYPSHISNQESSIIGLLKVDTARSITIFVLEHDLCGFGEIVDNVKKAPSTVSWHLKRLRDFGIISVHNGEYLLYRVNNKLVIESILSKYKESFVDKIVNNYVEMVDEL
ncbi:MAG: winged helix-turn-helix transcriptional regulator [Nitrososphaerales archaeon]